MPYYCTRIMRACGVRSSQRAQILQHFHKSCDIFTARPPHAVLCEQEGLDYSCTSTYAYIIIMYIRSSYSLVACTIVLSRTLRAELALCPSRAREYRIHTTYCDTVHVCSKRVTFINMHTPARARRAIACVCKTKPCRYTVKPAVKRLLISRRLRATY